MAIKLKTVSEVMATSDAKQQTEDDRSDVSLLIDNSLPVEDDEAVIRTTQDEGSQSIPAILNYCQNKILRPYLRLLTIVGLRPIVTSSERTWCVSVLSYSYMLFVLASLVVGYVLQYMACFRRDRGFYYEIVSIRYSENSKENHYSQICHGSMVFSYLLPSLLHVSAYAYALCVIRSSQDEKVSSLMERVFLSSSNPSDSSILCQRRLVRMLWLFVTLSVLWMITSLVSDNIFMAQGNIHFKWFESGSPKTVQIFKVLLIICTLWHDIIQTTIIASYCLQAQLLNSYLYFLHDKLIQQPTSTLDWIREMEEFKKLLAYLNISLSPPVSILSIANMAWGASGIVWLLNFDSVDKEEMPITAINVINVCLWIIMSLAPFVQAARLTTTCCMIQGVGHEARARPFVHKDTYIGELDSLLLYSSSLRLSATLFRVPITGKYLCLIVTFGAVLLLTLGQCHYLQ